MKKILLFAVVVLALVSCSGNKQAEAEGTPENAAITSTDVPVFTLDSLLGVAEQEVDKTIRVEGYVTHTCKHSGKRCFIVGEDQKASMRVEAGGSIGGFNRELVGSKLRITGTVKERRLSKEYIDQMEKGVNVKKQEEDGSAESCQAELNNIKEMREWMKEHNKEYYSIYYMDGQDYEVLE